jgi:hypothetical protein
MDKEIRAMGRPASHYIAAVAPGNKRRRNSHVFAREANNFYIEPEWCSHRLFDVEPFHRSAPLLDPCCGTGRVASAAKAHGYKVIAIDVVDRGFPGCRIQNFLERRSAPPSVVGNPPFPDMEAFARHALAIGAGKVALLARTASMNAAHWLRELPFSHALLLTPRPSMPPGQFILNGGKPKGDRTDYCWLIFERGYVGEPVIRWLHRDPSEQPIQNFAAAIPRKPGAARNSTGDLSS